MANPNNGSKPLSVLVLCGGAPRHLFVANALCSAVDVVRIITEVGSRPTLRKVVRLLTHPSILAQKIWRSRHDRKMALAKKEAEFFFGHEEPRWLREDLVTQIPYINHPDVIKMVQHSQPDVIAVFGTSLIREPLLSQARLAMVNLHGGISPHYRGADCTFWALYNHEPQEVGFTLHFIDPGIDTGKLIAHIRPEIRPDDNEQKLFWRGVQDSAEVYVTVLKKMAEGAHFGEKQTEKGKLYQVKDRKKFQQALLDERLANGLLAEIRLPKRITMYEK